MYTGDTTFPGLLSASPKNAFIFSTHTLIMELTYLDGDRSKAEEYGHVHIQDIIDNAELFENVTSIIFVHLSAKYSMSRAIKLLRDQLPARLVDKVQVSLHSFGATE